MSGADTWPGKPHTTPFSPGHTNSPATHSDCRWCFRALIQWRDVRRGKTWDNVGKWDHTRIPLSDQTGYAGTIRLGENWGNKSYMHTPGKSSTQLRHITSDKFPHSPSKLYASLSQEAFFWHIHLKTRTHTHTCIHHQRWRADSRNSPHSKPANRGPH